MALQEGMGMISSHGREWLKIVAAIAMAALLVLSLPEALAADEGSGSAAAVISEAGSSGLVGDLDDNCRVDIVDIMQVACRWQTSCENHDPDTPDYDALYDFNDALV